MLLDDGLEEFKKVPATNFYNWFAIGILWLGIGWCGMSGLILYLQVIIATILLIICTVITASKHELGSKLTLAVIALAAIKVIRFLPLTIFIGGEVNGIDIGIDLIMVAIGGIHLANNRAALGLPDYNTEPEQLSEEKRNHIFRHRVNKFKEHFENRTLLQLERLANNERLAPEAIQAAKELLSEADEVE